MSHLERGPSEDIKQAEQVVLPEPWETPELTLLSVPTDTMSNLGSGSDASGRAS